MSPEKDTEIGRLIGSIVLPILPAGILTNLFGFDGTEGPFFLFWVLGAVFVWQLGDL